MVYGPLRWRLFCANNSCVADHSRIAGRAHGELGEVKSVKSACCSCELSTCLSEALRVRDDEADGLSETDVEPHSTQAQLIRKDPSRAQKSGKSITLLGSCQTANTMQTGWRLGSLFSMEIGRAYNRSTQLSTIKILRLFYSFLTVLGSKKSVQHDWLTLSIVKCGATWVQQIVHGLRTRGNMNFNDIMRVMPSVDGAIQSQRPTAIGARMPMTLPPSCYPYSNHRYGMNSP